MRPHLSDSKKLILCALTLSAVIFIGNAVTAQDVVGSMSWKFVPVPGPSDELLSKFVKDKKAAIKLGKALFWDSRVGSDNKTACATCHFQAGADNRTKKPGRPGPARPLSKTCWQ